MGYKPSTFLVDRPVQQKGQIKGRGYISSKLRIAKGKRGAETLQVNSRGQIEADIKFIETKSGVE